MAKKKKIPPPWARTLTAGQIQTLAQRRATATLAPQVAAQEAERKRNRLLFEAEQGKIRGIGEAQAAILAKLAPELQAIYGKAAEQQGALSAGMGESVKQALAGVPGADANAIGDTLQYLGGLPATTINQQGARLAAEAAKQPGIAALRSGEEERQSIYRQSQEDARIVQAIENLRAKRPDLVQTAIDSIADLNLRARAQALYEKQYGLDERKQTETERSTRASERIQWAGLELKNQEQLTALQEADAAGREVNASASKAVGHFVDQFGRPILGPNGGKIPVVKNTGAGGNSFKDAVEGAREIHGEPMENPSLSTLEGLGTKGKYLARDNAKGVFRRPGYPASTNDPAKAKYDSEYTFQEALQYLVDVYGLSRKDARKALIRAKWRPEGKRPGGK